MDEYERGYQDGLAACLMEHTADLIAGTGGVTMIERVCRILGDDHPNVAAYWKVREKVAQRVPSPSSQASSSTPAT